ncbi:MAG: TRAP transporter substrate-binding protein [Lentilitoribacter sp.]
MGKLFNSALLVAGLLTASTAAQAEKWDMPTPYSDQTFHTVNIKQFADDVRAATDGKLDITIHSAGSLLKHGDIKNAIRSELVPIGEFFMGLLANENPAFGIDTLPLVATSYEDAQKLWAAQKPEVEKLLDRQKLKPLFSVPWPPQGLYTQKEIAKADDLKGAKFRSYNANLEKFASLIGAAPTQIEAPDIPQAFTTGRVEAMITSPSTGANTKAWDFVTHYSPINAWVPKNVVVINKSAFDALDEATQKAVMDAAAAAEIRGWEMSQKEATEKTKVLGENGISIVEPSEVLKADLAKIGAQLLEEWQASASPEAKTIVESYNQ